MAEQGTGGAPAGRPRLAWRERLILVLLIAVPFALSLRLAGRGLGPGELLRPGLALQAYLAVLYLYFLGVAGRAVLARAGEREDLLALAGRQYYLAHHFLAAVFYPLILAAGFLSPLAALPGQLARSLAAGLAVYLLAATCFYLAVKARPGARWSAIAGLEPRHDPREAANWRLLGLVYCNPENPAAWVGKRWGVGWTVNLGHPLARREIARLLAVTILLPLFIAILVLA